MNPHRGAGLPCVPFLATSVLLIQLMDSKTGGASKGHPPLLFLGPPLVLPYLTPILNVATDCVLSNGLWQFCKALVYCVTPENGP